MHWVTAEQCKEKNLDVVQEYPACATLFYNLLGTDALNISGLVVAAKTAPATADLSDRLKFLTRISRAIQMKTPEEVKGELSSLSAWVPFFPILKNRSDRQYDELAPLNPQFPPWFIADRHNLRDSFLGHVPLLAYAPEDLEGIDPFLMALGLEGRKLSRLVKVMTKPAGKPKVNKQYTLSLREKAPFIIS